MHIILCMSKAHKCRCLSLNSITLSFFISCWAQALAFLLLKKRKIKTIRKLMADVFLAEWACADGVHLSTAEMDALFDNVLQQLGRHESLHEILQMQDQLVAAALQQATAQGWRFRMGVRPFATATDSMQCRCAQWSLKRMSRPADQCMRSQHLPDDAWPPVFRFLVTHRTIRTVGPRIAEASPSHSSTWQRMTYTHTWSPRSHWRIVSSGATSTDAAIMRCGQSCLCCRAHNNEDWPSGCDQCIEGWVLSCVSKSWSTMLKILAATWKRPAPP